MMWGNAYILNKGNGLHVLDPRNVYPMLADDGSVFYQVSADKLAGTGAGDIYPASQVLHDRSNCLWHPLVGVSPLFACATSGTMAAHIQENSTNVFANSGKPSGLIMTVDGADKEKVDELGKHLNQTFKGQKAGNLAVTAGELKYIAFSPVNATDAQLIEQLGWTIADIARAFGVPLHKIDQTV
ncbi:phage portal protein, partial [Snodgrassella sp. CFCC 13594]|uniref:phage portal protein n=1 Tax=Snodgrassella sp. CFCC 13594 TaxID=1775559 RepID=UPI0035107E76